MKRIRLETVLWIIAVTALLLGVLNTLDMVHNSRMIDIMLKTQGIILQALDDIVDILTIEVYP